MARAKSTRNGSLAEAVRDLLQSQAALVKNQALLVAQKAELDRQIAETNRITDARFARIEAILIELSRAMQGLPDAVREKIGFKPPQQP
jgi:hypothetical protein